MLAVMLYYAWKHGWDGGFVIFLLGFYGCVGLFVYFVFLVPLLPLKIKVVALPVSRDYLAAKPLSEEEYESRSKSIRPMGIT
ncbi:MAG: hypothetical protein DMG37_00605 [Acidobacteria bacterium]|nr:MAG: hypothetical protein DMG37_00605 [Acidobacteriota bacterium]